MQKKQCGYLFLGTLILIVDRVTKMAALAWCADSAHTITSFLSFELFYNRGVAWSFLHFDSDYMFIGLSIVIAAITALVCWHAYHQYLRGCCIIGEVCIIAGSLSNLIDRAVYHGVIDFIILSYKDWSWPVFNIADAVIVLGVGIMIFQYEK
jgi:signal peptidase II